MIHNSLIRVIDTTLCTSNVRQLLAQLFDESAAVVFLVGLLGALPLHDAAVAQAASGRGRAVRDGQEGEEEGEGEGYLHFDACGKDL